MTAPGSSAAFEGMYSQLIEDERTYDELNRRTDVGHSVSPVKLPPRMSGPGPYRFTTFCLAALCAILLIAIVAVTAHYKNKPQGGGAVTPEIQKQTQDVNMSALMSSVRTLQQEKTQLQKEMDELQAKLDAMMASKAPEVMKPTGAAPAPIVCPVDWHLFNNSCYFISRDSMDWPDSQSFCQSKGGHLAIIHTAEEQTFVWDLLPRGHWNAYWFGITDEYTEDKWKWVDGTPLVGGFWEVGEPNNHIDEDCGYIVKTLVLERVATRSWYDAPCMMNWPYICEKEMGTGASTATPH
ncbi:C-type lectin domain family 4 member E-like [Toxotes jaculatrix]|uniref:C-type lectin domain family 4 member E-like n=1 Tax=Toxotes jaculatrix TaxID=941984 RepID=UPI001B3AC12D|nr:C-type lectin domain family 4 member E-like [Toxotes jaculatrix]